MIMITRGKGTGKRLEKNKNRIGQNSKEYRNRTKTGL
jgi:hypothetical protein